MSSSLALDIECLCYKTMPEFQLNTSWRLEDGGQIIDLETAIKDGILGGGGANGYVLCSKDGIFGNTDKFDLKKMMEELESSALSSSTEDVPTVFICPISLEPMVDPVTLCTGQTYERENIMKWFSLGRQICPTTMQELWDDDVTPNRTLHQLIHDWFLQRYLRMKKQSQDVEGCVIELVLSLKRVKGQARVEALKELQRLVITHPNAKKGVLNASSIVFLCSLLGPFTTHAVGSEVIAVLVNLSLDSDVKLSLMQPSKIALVVDILSEGTVETKINCIRLIEMLMEEKSFRSDILLSLSLLAGLLRLVKDKRFPDGMLAGLCLLKTICSHKQALYSMVSIGMVRQLVELLPCLNSECLAMALQILDDLSTIPEGLLALKDCPQTIPNAVRFLMRASEDCTKSTLSILWAVCKFAPDECASLAVEAGLAAKLLLVIQSACAPELKQQAAYLLKLCRLNYSTTMFISKCKLTRTIQ